jgi:DNA-binding transcriptional LysR family regulator
MNTDQLKQFCTVYEIGTLAKASELHHLTVGALSRSIKRLEEEVDIRLFTQDGRSLRVTEAGKRFYILCKQIITDLDTGIKEMRSESNEKKEIRIGSFEVFTSRLLVGILSQCFKDRRAYLAELAPGEIEKALQGGAIDLGITYVPVPKKGLEHIKVGSFKMIACSGSKRFSGCNFSDIPFAIPTTQMTENTAQLAALDGWPLSFPRKINYRFELLETALEASRKGLSAVHIPEFIAAEEKFMLIPLPPNFRPVTMTCFLVKREGFCDDSIGTLVRELKVKIQQKIA